MQTSKFFTKDSTNYYIQSLHLATSGLWWCPIDQAFNNLFEEKLGSIQYNACLTLTGAIRGTSKEKNQSRIGIGVPSRSMLVLKAFPFLQGLGK